jgi:preprotein translocase subunit YajC
MFRAKVGKLTASVLLVIASCVLAGSVCCNRAAAQAAEKKDEAAPDKKEEAKDDKEAKKGTPEMAFWQNPIILIPVLFALFYFVVLRPQQRRMRQEQDSMMANLKKNDEVVTSAGIFGTVANIKDEEVTLKIDDNARIRVLKSTIARVINKTEPPKDGAPGATPPAANTGIKPN